MDQEQRRLQLHEILEALLGSTNVYFQPPSTTQMAYPCIVYNRDRADTKFAGDKPYLYTKRYQVTYIDRSPISPVPDQIALLPQTTHSRSFAAQNLNHDVFDVYF